MSLAISVGIIVVIILAITGIFASRYATVSADEALIVTGSFLGNKNVQMDDSGRQIKIVRGGGTFIFPIFQQGERLSLLSHKLEISTPEVYTSEGVPVLVDGTALIKIGGSIEDIATAAEQFLSKEDDELQAESREVLEGHLRAILGTMTVEEIYKNRDRFAQEVQNVAAKDLKKMGLVIVSFTIKDVRDKHGYLEALGKPRIAAVKRDAEIAEAEANRDSRIKKALANEEAQKAELIRDTNVAEATKAKELKVASFKKEQDTARAEADQAYFIQEARSKQSVVEEQMRVELVRKEREIDLEEKEILRREKQYDAEVKKKADAEKYKIEREAEAEKMRRMRQAEADTFAIQAQAKVEAEKVRLEGEAKADAEKVQGIARAEAEKAQGLANAEVIRLRGLAEAEAKEKLAEAFNKFGEAAVLDIIVKMLPELASQVAAPMANIDKLTVVDAGGNSGGAAKLSNTVTNLMATMPEMLKDVSGIDLKGLIEGLTNKNPITSTGSISNNIPNQTDVPLSTTQPQVNNSGVSALTTELQTN